MFRKNDGFTLVELMVTILVASIVTLAATTILLLGVRIMHKSNDTAERQNTTRVLLTALENLAAEGIITEIRDTTDPATSEITGWEVCNADKVVFSYDGETKTIYTGTKNENTPLLTDVDNASVELGAKVLTFSITMDAGTYNTSVYCRMAPTSYRGDQAGTNLVYDLIEGVPGISDENAELTVREVTARNAFLRELASQYGSRGVIMGAENREAGQYYSEWYIGGYSDANPTWNQNTPWCACYISWALDQSTVGIHIAGTSRPCYAQVEDFREYFETRDLLTTSVSGRLPGDLVFFNTDEDAEYDHMGVVLAIQDNILYTIEGNSYNRVRVRDYDLTSDENGIVAYGVLPWIE